MREADENGIGHKGIVFKSESKSGQQGQTANKEHQDEIHGLDEDASRVLLRHAMVVT